MGGEEDDKKSHFTNNTPYEKHLEKYLKYKAKYLNLKNRETFTNNLKFPQNGGTGNNSNIWENENNWTNKGAFKKCMELVQHVGHPNFVSHNKNMVEFVKWQKELDVQNFTFGSIKGVDMIKITNYNPKKMHPYSATVYVIVGKFINVPNALFGPLKYASETINIEQLSVPRQINNNFVNNNVKERALVTGSCASVTISAITIKFVEDMVARDNNKTFGDITPQLYEEYRNEYGKRIANYLCGGGTVPKIDWFTSSDFGEKHTIDKSKVCK